jgi:hypothetical protein
VYRSITGRAFPPKDSFPVTGALGHVDSNALTPILRSLREDGFARWPTRLDPEMVRRLHDFARSAPALRRLRLHSHEPVECYPGADAQAKRYDFDQQVMIENSDIRALVFDPSVRAVAAAVLGCEPVQDLLAMWWSTPFRPPADQDEQQRSAAAQLHHFDMDRLGFIKMFFYLTDVTPETGPLCLVRGSHLKKPEELWRDGRISDAEIAAHFPPEQRMELPGSAGTILLVDTRAFHQGKPPVSGERLLFQIEWSIDLYGTPYKTLTLPADTEPMHRNLVADRCRAFERFTLS